MMLSFIRIVIEEKLMNDYQLIEKSTNTIRLSLLKTNIESQHITAIQKNSFLNMIESLYHVAVECNRLRFLSKKSYKSGLIDVQKQLFLVETIIDDFNTIQLITDENHLIYKEHLGKTFTIVSELIKST